MNNELDLLNDSMLLYMLWSKMLGFKIDLKCFLNNSLIVSKSAFIWSENTVKL